MTKKSRILALIFLELLAIKLALLQLWIGVRTDEAKYLLNIPYPHPPVLRWKIGLTEFLPFQELFWRIVLATIVIQAVWLIWDMSRNQKQSLRIVLCIAWILSSAVLFQAGTVMMAPVTAVHALLFLWIASRPKITEEFPVLMALLWFVSLFVAYQAVLFLPIVWMLFWRAKHSFFRCVLYVFAPIVLLALYTLSNPLALASFVLQGTKDAGDTLSERLLGTLRIWAIGGSIVLSAIGTIGILLSRRLELIGSLLLVIAFIFLARHDYYAILFAPLFIEGIRNGWKFKGETLLIPGIIVGLIATYFLYPPSLVQSSARDVMQQIDESVRIGDVLIHGITGHEWQYESRRPIRKFSIDRLENAQAVICLEACPDMDQQNGWQRRSDVPSVWVRE